MPVPRLKVEDLSQSAIALFKKKAIGRGRLTEEETKVSDHVLMDNLRLYDDDGYLTRAAALAFYPDPERWITGAYIKIGFFGESDSDLLYQDEIHGPLIEQIDKTMDLIYTKYMKALITYQGIQRIERFFFHPDSCREILLNAVIHKAYESCNPIQISVYEDHMYIWNEGKMPEELDSTEKLFEKHSSKPYNPKLANTFFKSGMIEAWGRGFDKIRRGCEEYGGPLPKYEFSGGVMVLCNACDLYLQLMRENGSKGTQKEDAEKHETTGRLSEKLSEKLAEKLSDKEMELLKLLVEEPACTTSNIAEKLGVSRVTITKRLRNLKDKGIIVRVGSDRKGYWKIME
ncbi:MAG: winged helix-turn-helix transcriptional regulator [Lachnospiraceae bacterium]|nr:winged helix-turn-helix transcriptional regulator [Lachnospiraceae bacterium]